ncbi:recombinase [Providencia rettgeri]|uniref:Recombinase n=1 Tax=Providencia rettgeri TaxID=587 RepID=A0A264VLE9_PRORE|nr:phage protein NinX family protein [Providencia rettgeri]OZS72132.1 recombinase [Providencia rettgeri]
MIQKTDKYTELSDFEINLAVAHIVLGKDNYDWCPDKKEVYLAGIDGGDFLPHGYFDPCNNPTDAMPIIIENKIGLSPMYHSNKWTADCLDYDFISVNKNPLRAAMELFLLMKDAENENNNNG